MKELSARNTPLRTPVDSPLYKAFQQAMQDMTAIPHETDILRGAVNTLPIQDRALKHVAEFLP